MVNRRIAIIVAIALILGCVAGTTAFAQHKTRGTDNQPPPPREQRRTQPKATPDDSRLPSRTDARRTTIGEEPTKGSQEGETESPETQALTQPPSPEPVTASEIFSSLPRFGENIFAKVREPEAKRQESETQQQDPEREWDTDRDRETDYDRQTDRARQMDQNKEQGREEQVEPQPQRPQTEEETQQREEPKREPRYQTPYSMLRAPAGSPLANVPIPVNYQLGPADTLQIQIWNLDRQRAEKTATITADGYITLPVLGKLTINGMTMSEAQEHIRKRATKFYSNPEIVMELVRPRTVDVYVIGDVVEPGKYALPGNATVFTALYAAGGPSETGSYRRIKLNCATGEQKQIDLYEYLMHGRRQGDELLQTGDTVFVPPVEQEIGVAGAVRRPARYEILQRATVEEAIDLASGFTPDANKSDVAIWRPDDRDRWELSRVDATSKDGSRAPVANGALVDVSPILDRAPSTVTLIGPVYRPGVYEVTEGLTVGGLIKRAEGPRDQLYMDRGDIWRLNNQYDYDLVPFSPSDALAGIEDPALQGSDIVYLYNEQRVAAPRVVEVTGQVRKPGVYPHARGMKVRDLILRAGDVSPGAYMSRAEITRITEDQREELIAVDLQKALAGDDDENIALKPQDTLRVLNREEVADPSEVHIAGFVREPGTYPRYEGMHVSDLIMAAGGLTPDAGRTINYTPGHFQGKAVSKELSIHGDPDDFQVEPDLVLNDDDSLGVSGLSDFTVVPKMASIKGEVARPGVYPLREEDGRERMTDTIYSLIKRAGGLRDTANPQGMILYRVREEIIPEDRQDDLTYIFRMLNREKEETMTGLTSGEEAEIIASSAATKATSEFGGLLGTESGALLVVPPRRLGISRWIRAIPVDGAKILESEGKQNNLKLHQGDVLRIPKKVDFVTVVGSVSSPGAVQFTSDAHARDYIDHAGGALPDADMSRIIVMRANGAVLPAQKAKDIRAGDVIIVPSQHMFRAKHVGKPWLQSLTDLLSIGAAALLL